MKKSNHKLANKGRFVNPTKGILNTVELIKDIKEFVDQEPKSLYQLIIGTDSQSRSNNGHSQIDYVTAIVIYRKGRGARYYWKKQKDNKIPVLRDKIYTETLMSLETAQTIVPRVRKRITPTKYDFEIHIDVGPLGPTRDMIREVVGMVNGNGYKAKTKPSSWAASSVADKHA